MSLAPAFQAGAEGASLPEPLRRTWARLALSTGQADPFCCSPLWQLAFHDVFAPKRRLFLTSSERGLLAFAETALSPAEVFLAPLEAHWFFGCPLLGPEGPELLAANLDALAQAYAPAFPKIIIGGVRPGGRLAHRLLRRLGGRFDFYLIAEGVQGAASLSGGLDGFLSRRSANHRGKLGRAARRALREGVCFERVLPATPPEAATAYARMLAVERSSWKGIGRCGMAETPSREFYDLMLGRLAAEKSGRIIFARHGGRDIGFIFGGLAGRVYRGQQFSYAEDWRDWSIGNLMQLEQVRWLCEDGARRYDMGPLSGPRMGYKSHWTEKRLTIQTWIMIKKPS